ncbi:MAG: SH3 domain-containing protein [Cyanobacteria bacterium J06633_8]
MASALILGSTLTISAPVAAQTQESVQATSYQVAQRRGSRAYVCTRDRYGYLNFRSRPSLRSRIIGRINNRQYVTILSSSGNWYKVRYRGRIGWVSGDFVCRGNSSQNSQFNSKNKIRITMYVPNIKSSNYYFETKTVYVSATRPVRDIVGKLIKENIFDGFSFRVINYKVTVNNRVARINFITDSKPTGHGIHSATTTQSFSLESLHKTLTKNSKLNIDKVMLYENGERTGTATDTYL